MRFDRFTIDLARCVLLRGSEPVPLRPKSFDVLRYLVDHPGRIVTKDELFAAIWRDVSVTDDSLVQCIKEIRRALDDSEHRLLKTYPKRGYLLDTEIAHETAVAAASRQGVEPATPASGRMSPAARFLQTMAPAIPARAALLASIAAAFVGLAVAAGGLIASHDRAPSANATHVALLGTAMLDKERSPKANREALALFDKALALDSGHVLALAGYARTIVMDVTEGWAPAQERALRLDQAEAALRRALAAKPEDGRAHHVYGLLWRARGDADRAVHHLEKALQAMPAKAWVLADLGRARLEAGEPRKAIQELEAAIRLAPDEPYIFIWHFQAGMAAVHAADAEAALAWLHKSEAASPAYHRHVKLWRSVALADLGREEEARALVADYLATSTRFTVATWVAHFPSHNAAVAAQRARIGRVLERLGVPPGDQSARLR